jgi:predicted PurR-regulated permease PerM
MKFLREFAKASCCSSLLLAGLQSQVPPIRFAQLRAVSASLLPALLLLGTTREGIYNILWGLVFAFATLNILSLGARRFEAHNRGLSFGEVLAIMVVLVSILLLGWELLYQFQVLPIRFTPE